MTSDILADGESYYDRRRAFVALLVVATRPRVWRRYVVSVYLVALSVCELVVAFGGQWIYFLSAALYDVWMCDRWFTSPSFARPTTSERCSTRSPTAHQRRRVDGVASPMALVASHRRRRRCHRYRSLVCFLAQHFNLHKAMLVCVSIDYFYYICFCQNSPGRCH